MSRYSASKWLGASSSSEIAWLVFPLMVLNPFIYGLPKRLVCNLRERMPRIKLCMTLKVIRILGRNKRDFVQVVLSKLQGLSPRCCWTDVTHCEIHNCSGILLLTFPFIKCYPALKEHEKLSSSEQVLCSSRTILTLWF